MSERTESFTGKRGLISQVMLTVMETGKGTRLTQVIDYPLSDDEKLAHAGRMLDKTVTLGIREINMFGGRVRVRGELIDPPLKPKV